MTHSLEVEDAVTALRAARLAWRGQRGEHDVSRFPSPDALTDAIAGLSAALYPVRLGRFEGRPADEDRFVAEALVRAFAILREQITREFGYWQGFARDPFDALGHL